MFRLRKWTSSSSRTRAGKMQFSRKRYDSSPHTLERRIVDLCCEIQITRDVGLDTFIQELVANAASDDP